MKLSFPVFRDDGWWVVGCSRSIVVSRGLAVDANSDARRINPILAPIRIYYWHLVVRRVCTNHTIASFSSTRLVAVISRACQDGRVSRHGLVARIPSKVCQLAQSAQHEGNQGSRLSHDHHCRRLLACPVEIRHA